MDLKRDIYLARCKRTQSSRAQLEFWKFVDDSYAKLQLATRSLHYEMIPS
jgi:hypothetical protein